MKSVAVYAGTFDPPTLGHLDVLMRVAPLFDRVHVVVAHNHKKKSLFSSDERVALIEASLKELKAPKNIDVDKHEGLTIDYCRKKKARVMIRGLRAVSDFESELQMAMMNRRIRDDIETLHVMTAEKFLFLSSSLIKEVFASGASVDGLVPKCVARELERKINGET
jgi:pantetheine-phosphate adenylyltransferase